MTFITDQPIRFDPPGAGELEGKFGAVVTFTGIVRNLNEGRRVAGIFYECYRGMAERECARLVEEIERRFSARVLEVVHRVGEVSVGEISLVVVVAAPHRREAVAACDEVVSAIKRRVPIWKKERYTDESARWL